MPELWLPGAERHPLTDTAPTTHDGRARTIWHITWDRNATAAKPQDLVPFDNLVSYFTSAAGRGSAPHLLWDPFTGRIAQFFPATSRSKSVVNLPGGVETNREGDVCIQIETVFFPHCRAGGKTYATVRDTPTEGLADIMAWLRSWNVPDHWPMGAPTWSAHRDAHTWDTTGGHYGHSQVPENDHTDPGPMPDLFADAPAPKPTPAPAPKPQPAVPAFAGRNLAYRPSQPLMRGSDVTAWQVQMRKRGWTITADGVYGEQSARVCRAFQAEKHLAEDGIVGRITWAATWTSPVT